MDTRFVEVVQRLSLCREVDGIVAVLREATRSLIGADGVTVVLRDQGNCHYVDENAIAPLWKGKRFPLESCITGVCMLDRTQIAIEDIYADARIPHDLYRPTFVRSLVVTPIRSLDPLGAIGAYWAERHAATPEEMATLQAIADSAAVAFENASLIASLTHASRRKDEFLLMLAHELRNPLAPALNAAHVLRSAPGGAGTKGEWAIEVIERQVRQLARITDGLLDTSRIVSGKMRLAHGRIDLAALARAAIADYAARVQAERLEIVADIPQAPVWIEGDDPRVAQVIANLLDNAIKFTPRGGTITVALASEGPHALLRIRDTGVGIDPAFLPNVFESFAQEDRSLDRARGGLGLGLTIARSLAQAHGGDIAAHSEGPGKGTEVTLRLPRQPEPSALEPTPVATEASPVPLRIVVVEDNEDAAETLQLLLDGAGHTVFMARDGHAGVRAVRLHRPDVVLCDIGLPGLDGFQVARCLRADPATADTRLIAITGYGSEEARAEALAAGFDQHLTKPVAPAALLEDLAHTPRRNPAAAAL